MWDSSAGMMPSALGVTLGRLAQGFALGGLAGLCCGLLLGRLPGPRRQLQALLSMLRLAPLLALLPAAMLLFGVGSAARVGVIAVSCFLLVVLYTLDAVRSIDPAFARLASHYGASKLALVRRVYLPATLPRIFTGLRLALATGWIMAVSAELVEPQDGLGGMIMAGWRAAAPEPLCLGALLSVVMAMAMHAAWRHFEAILFPWDRSAKAGRTS